MQLTQFTDYSFRVLMFLAVKDDAATIGEIVESYNVSRNHLTKVVHNLARMGYIKSARGKGGGIRLARKPEEINIGRLVLATEPNFDLVECFKAETAGCPLTPACMLRRVLGEAQRSFIETLDRYTLADLVRNRDMLAGLFTRRPVFQLPDRSS